MKVRRLVSRMFALALCTVAAPSVTGFAAPADASAAHLGVGTAITVAPNESDPPIIKGPPPKKQVATPGFAMGEPPVKQDPEPGIGALRGL